MRKKTYFVSDVHLGFPPTPEGDRHQGVFLQFLDEVEKEAAALYILGDLFDFWFEWRHVIPRYFFEVFCRLRQLVRKGIPVYLLAGNHDFHFRDYIHKSVGIQTATNSMTPLIGGRRFYLSHGDGVGPGDTGYKILKKAVRHPLSIFLFKTFIPPDAGMWLARKVSGSSRKNRVIDRTGWLNTRYRPFAREKLEAGFDFVILGHIHHPRIVKLKKGILACSGDFISHFSYLVYNGSDLVLKNFAPEEIL